MIEKNTSGGFMPMDQATPKEEKKPWYKKPRGILIIVIIVIGITVSISPELNVETSQEAKLADEESQRTMSIAEKKPKEPSNWEEHTNKSLEILLKDSDITKIEKGVPGYISLNFDSDSWDENESVFRTSRKAAKWMKKLFSIKGVNRVWVQLDGTFTDQNGQSKKEKAVAISINKETADKIDWNNVNDSNRAGLFRVAEETYIHPAIMTNITSNDIKEAIDFPGSP